MATTLTLPSAGSVTRRQERIAALARLQERAISAGQRVLFETPGTDVERLLQAALARPEVRKLNEDARQAVVDRLRGVAVNLARSRLDVLGGALAHLSPAQQAVGQALVTGFTGRDGRSQARPVRRPSLAALLAREPGARAGRAPRRPRPPRKPRPLRPPRAARPARPPRARRPERDPRRRNIHLCAAPMRHFKATGELGCIWADAAQLEAQKAAGNEVRVSEFCAACGGHGCRGPLAPLGNFVAQAIFGPPEVGRAEREITRRGIERRQRRRRPPLIARIEDRAAARPAPPVSQPEPTFCATVNCIVPGIGGTRCFATEAAALAWRDAETARCQAATPGYFVGGPR